MAKTEVRSRVVLPRRPKHVYIVEHQVGGQTEYRVSFPAIHLSGGDTLVIVNTTNQQWSWHIRGFRFLQSPMGNIGPFTRVSVFTLPALRQGGPVETYEYTLMAPNGATAKGMSDPMIIIDPNG